MAWTIASVGCDSEECSDLEKIRRHCQGCKLEALVVVGDAVSTRSVRGLSLYMHRFGDFMSTFDASSRGNVHGRSAWLHSFVRMSIHVQWRVHTCRPDWSDCALKAFVDSTARQKSANVPALAYIMQDPAVKLPANLRQISGLHCCFQSD